MHQRDRDESSDVLEKIQLRRSVEDVREFAEKLIEETRRLELLDDGEQVVTFGFS